MVELSGAKVGTEWERFIAKARACFSGHDNNLAVQRVRRNRQLTTADLAELEGLLADSGACALEDIERARQEAHGLGLFVRSLVGLDREAATEPFSGFLAGSTFTSTEINFIQLIVEDLTANGVMDPSRLFEAPFTDVAPAGPLALFADHHVDNMTMILDQVRSHAEPAESVA